MCKITLMTYGEKSMQNSSKKLCNLLPFIQGFLNNLHFALDTWVLPHLFEFTIHKSDGKKVQLQGYNFTIPMQVFCIGLAENFFLSEIVYLSCAAPEVHNVWEENYKILYTLEKNHVTITLPRVPKTNFVYKASWVQKGMFWRQNWFSKNVNIP